MRECMEWLHEAGRTVHVQCYELLQHEEQVLSGRTHPMMVTSATGGYLLSGVTVERDEKTVEARKRKMEASRSGKSKEGKSGADVGWKRKRALAEAQGGEGAEGMKKEEEEPGKGKRARVDAPSAPACEDDAGPSSK